MYVCMYVYNTVHNFDNDVNVDICVDNAKQLGRIGGNNCDINMNRRWIHACIKQNTKCKYQHTLMLNQN